jgi:sialidase-1
MRFTDPVRRRGAPMPVSALALLVACVLASLGGSARAQTPVDVFTGGAEGYPVYRIPSTARLATGPRAGRVVVFAEGRAGAADNGTNDIVLKWSDDDGATWSPLRVVRDEPGRSLNNPCPVEVREGPHAGRLVLMYQSYREGCGEHCVPEGYEGDDVARTFVMHSDDGGESWSEPRDVTRGVKRPTGATATATGPGMGIQLRRGPFRGRLLFGVNEGPVGKWRVYAVRSDDGGDTWAFGEPAPEASKGVGNETMLFERDDGAVVLNARSFYGASRRKSAVSSDGGVHFTGLVDVAVLPDPCCMAGVAVVTDPLDGAPVQTVVYTGCDSEKERANGAMWISRDGGRSWPMKLPLHAGGFGYSQPVALGADTVLVVFERDGCEAISVLRRRLPPVSVDPTAAPAPRD